MIVTLHTQGLQTLAQVRAFVSGNVRCQVQYFCPLEIFIALKQTFVNRHNRHIPDNGDQLLSGIQILM